MLTPTVTQSLDHTETQGCICQISSRGVGLFSLCIRPEAVQGQDCPRPLGGQRLLLLEIFDKLFSE